MATFGYYGKIPTQGDFLRRDLSPGFVEPWDRWLQGAMLTARETLGTGWQEAYFSAPLWRFALAPGVCGPSAIAGVLMPSVDRVGRQFPMTIAAEIEAPDAWTAWRTAFPAFPALEEAALATLDDDGSREALDRALGSLAPRPAPGPIAMEGADGAVCVVAADTSVAELLAGAFMAAPRAHGALWACEIDGRSRVMATAGLPAAAEEVHALMDLSAPLWPDSPPAAFGEVAR